MKKIPLSVFIITKNEEDRIEKIINSVKKIADEILIIDSGSSDKTCNVALNAGAKVVFHQWKGYGQQKIFGESQCRNRWVLNIDADEEVSEALSDEVLALFKKNQQNKFQAYRIKIVNKFFGEEKPHKYAYYYNQIRLYNREFAGFKNSAIHDSVELKKSNPKKIGQLKNIVHHQSFRSFSHWIEKINSYSSMQAAEAFEKGKNVSIAKVFLTPVVAFFKAYFVRRYFVYGFNGVIFSVVFAFSRFAKVIKIREGFKKSKILISAS